MKRILLCALTMGGGFTLQATVTGYDRFYNSHNNAIIDVIYDTHVYEDKLSRRDFRVKSYSYIEQRLYPTEKRLMSALRKLNEDTPNCVDVIWEQGIYSDIVEQFLGHADRLVKDQFPHLNFIASDISRDAFEQLFNAPGQRSLDREVAGVSINNPVPLPDERIAGIIANSGDLAWQEYKKYHAARSKAASDCFREFYLSGVKLEREDFRGYDRWNALTDIEMLSYILSSNKPHVIVYAGGWHSKNIALFLEKIGCKRIYQAHDGGYELYEKHLDLLDSGAGYDPHAVCPDCGRAMKDHK